MAILADALCLSARRDQGSGGRAAMSRDLSAMRPWREGAVEEIERREAVRT
jgi:hypothetical protein